MEHFFKKSIAKHSEWCYYHITEFRTEQKHKKGSVPMRIDNKKLALAVSRACINSKELCEKAGIGKQTLINIKSGARTPKPSTIGRIARALHIDVTEILEE